MNFNNAHRFNYIMLLNVQNNNPSRTMSHLHPTPLTRLHVQFGNIGT